MNSCKGRLLVATPVLTHPDFDRTVVFMIEHTEESALGVVINRPSTTLLADALPAWDRFAAHPAVVFVGGPVEETAVICLAAVTEECGEDVCARVMDDLGTFDITADPDEVGADVDQLRIFAGYAGWTAGQLDDEIEAGAWFVVDADIGDAFNEDPEELWSAVLRRQPGRTRIYANFPPSLSVN